ncbi:hypothetical protein Hypma_001699 [Hypsizygus marmoreus]|uniref:Uncharacterized protein n=1 Tax=Hypsizygus marmoreus TaxID=39966 RepID=A0A369J572_HYPMA|nr:hypothetical protein Hypma_001699 [Hypsizygus marmoreus]
MATEDAPQPTRFQLPGFGLPLNYIPPGLFSNALVADDVSLPLTTLREFTMLRLMNQLTDKPDWHQKVFDDTITAKWKSEALATRRRLISEKIVDWCIAELRYKARIFEDTGAVSVYNGDVVKSDTAIATSLKDALRKAVTPLEGVPAHQQDWHPGSNQKVLDLVHPSLFPLIYGRSRILRDSLVGLDDCISRCGDGEIIPIPPKEEASLSSSRKQRGVEKKPFSTQFQWLPCDVDISDENDTKITSYINNLHPGMHKDLYNVIEKIIHRTIPIWNLTLTPLKIGTFYHTIRIKYDKCVYDPDPEMGPATDGPQQEEDEDDDEFYERRNEWYGDTRQVVQPEPETFKPPEARMREHIRDRIFVPGTTELKPEYSTDLRRDYRLRGLQIIVKLANIHLTPENPKYEGGTWHVEGQLNEHICATAIYYYDNENITTSSIAFRQQSSTTDAQSEVSYRQDHHDWLEEVFGCEQGGEGVQDVGSVDTLEGRLLSWPNILQHQVQPFKLADMKKPGHRKILALFLVDPNIRIISSANVPCQQREWWSDAIKHDSGAISGLPAELQGQIFKDVEDFPISLEEAKEFRVKLMDERRHYVFQHNLAFRQPTFSLCEH